MVTDSVRTLALWTGLVGVAGLVALVLMSMGLGLLGPVNDVLGAVTAVLTLLLALAARDLLPGPHLARVLALSAAVVGAVLAVTGSVLVLSGRTGWYLAGLWSALGWGLLGVWFLALVLGLRTYPDASSSLTLLGVVGGILMIVGLGVLPGIVGAVDDWGSAGWRLVVPQVAGYLGSVLLLTWCLAVGRSSS